MDRELESVDHAKMLPTLGSNYRYWQIEAEENNWPKTVLTSAMVFTNIRRCHLGGRMLRKYSNARSILFLSQSSGDARYHTWTTLSFSGEKTNDHISNLDSALEMFSKTAISLKLRKCNVIQSSLDYLGHVVHPEQLAVASKTVDAVEGISPPMDMTEPRPFFGLCNVYGRFVPNFELIVLPSKRTSRKGELAKSET